MSASSSILSIWISSFALIISLSSFLLSLYVAKSNANFATAQKKSDLLTRIREAKIRYEEFNRRYKALVIRKDAISPQTLETIVQFKEFEKWTQEHYDFLFKKDKVDVIMLERMRHHIDSILLSIAADNKRIDEWEADEEKINKK